MSHKLNSLGIGLAAGSLILSGCGGGQSAEGADVLNVVASTDVYGHIIQTIAGDGAQVEAIIDDPTQDPHSYEATPQDQLTLSKADIVVLNGGGYDSFMTTLLEAADAQPTTIDAVAASGRGAEAAEGDHAHDDGDHAHDGGDHAHDGGDEATGDQADHDHAGHDHGSFNEHVWYSVPAMESLADEIANALVAADPSNEAEFTANAAGFKDELEELHVRIESISETHADTDVAVTEPTPLYLFEDMGLHNTTPAAFTQAIEEGGEVSPLVYQEALDLVENERVALLGVNTQSATPETEKLADAAQSAGVPVVEVTETIPDGYDNYIDWMDSIITEVEEALR